MQEPPIYSSMPPKKKNGCLIWGLAIGGTCLVCMLAIGGGGLFFWNKGKELIGCTFEFETIRGALKDYAREHKGHLPKAATWMEDIRPYYSKTMDRVGKDAAFLGIKGHQGAYGCDQGGQTTGIAFNKDLSDKKLDDVKDPYETVLIFETENPAQNLSEKFKQRPKETSPKIMNEHRGWMTLTISGDLRMGDKPAPGARGSFRMEGSADNGPGDVISKDSEEGDEKGETPKTGKAPKKPGN